MISYTVNLHGVWLFYLPRLALFYLYILISRHSVFHWQATVEDWPQTGLHIQLRTEMWMRQDWGYHPQELIKRRITGSTIILCQPLQQAGCRFVLFSFVWLYTHFIGLNTIFLWFWRLLYMRVFARLSVTCFVSKFLVDACTCITYY